jgi:hypothetical protein
MNKSDITKAFDDLGGMKELVRLAKNDVRTRLQFFAMAVPKLLHPDVLDDAEESLEVLQANMVHALTRAIEVQYIDTGVVTVDGEVVHDGKPTRFGAVDWMGHPIMNIDDGSGGVTDADTPDAGAANQNPHNGGSDRGIIDTIPKAIAAQPQYEEPKPDDGITKPPKPDHVQHVVKRDKPAPHSDVVGLYAGKALGEGSAPDYGVNWSQQKAWY